MTKRDARNRVDSGECTVGEMRAVLDGARGRDRKCKLNPGLTLEQFLDVMDAYFEGRDDAEVASGRRDPIVMTNILRECG